MIELWMNGLAKPEVDAIQTIKTIRMVTAFGLKESKDMWDLVKVGKAVKLVAAETETTEIPESYVSAHTKATIAWAVKELKGLGILVSTIDSNPVISKMKKAREALAELQAALPEEIVAQMGMELSVLADSLGIEGASRPAV